MQFITNGPDIPDAFLQAHEEGRIVFFCGAGISHPAGLPGFKGLVDEIYRLNGTVRSDIEREAFDRGQFDATLDLLERRLPGQRPAVRLKLAQALKPKLRRKGATDTHAALLRLARSRQGELRLVTTNFDRVFHAAAKRTQQAFQEYAAPMLPIPKNSRWNGLVYLHGLLPEKTNDDTALNRLVITSGDFGLAYLVERWAARFVSELFRNFVVCFVGYSINDPMLRYMMDALAVDRMLGEVTPRAWALGDCEPGQEKSKIKEWEAKGVTPILYAVPSGDKTHSALHKTLHAWADTYRDGVLGKKSIVAEYACVRPSASTKQDDFVGRMLWALSDKSGLPAQYFADFNPVPPLEWLLDACSDERYQHNDLARFGVPPRDEVDPTLRFSLIRRPAPYDRALPMLLAFGGITGSAWDKVMKQLARWLVRHLDDPRLVIWIAQRGGQLHNDWSLMIKQELERFAKLERDGKIAELDEIRSNAPKAIPSPQMRTLWRLLLSGRVKSLRHADLDQWKARLKREGVTITLRLELRELLAPQVVLKELFRWGDVEENTDDPTRIRQLVDWELVLAADHAHTTLYDLADEYWTSALPQLLEEFQQLLRDALDLLRELGEADDRSDRSHWDLPSVSPHWQNRGFRDWVTLIELLRDAWLTVRSQDNARATRIAQTWFDLPYPTFKRLALFAASQDGCIVPEQWVDWLLADDAWWLWSTDMQREMFRLLVLQGRQLAGATQERLESAILAGPPRAMYPDDVEPDQWQNLVDRSVCLHLAKLNTSGLALGATAKARLAELSSAYPKRRLATHEKDEFSHWMSGTNYPDDEESRVTDRTPRKRDELVQWLTRSQPGQRPFYEDNWRKVCQKHPLNSLCALHDLAYDDKWLTERWNTALYAWSEKERLVLLSWRYAAPLVQTMPETVLLEIAQSVTYWLKRVSESINQHEEILLNLCRLVLCLPLEAGTGMTNDPVHEAINHPVGHVTEALIKLWFKRNPNDNDQLPSDIKLFFTQLCDVRVDRFRHGRVLLSSRLITIFRVDRTWTKQNLLPLFSWDNPGEAKALWEGFLWSPRLYPPLMIAFKPQFLEIANHYDDLGKDWQQQFATFLTYAALETTEGYTVDEFRSAIKALPQEGLEESAQALVQALEGSADQCAEYWKNRVQPFWQKVWPKSLDHATPRIAASLTRLIIAARSEFPAALDEMKYWLKPIEHPDYEVHLLHESGLCSKFPAAALHLLDAVIDEQPWAPQELGHCLDAIVQAAPQLKQETGYQQLREYFLRRKI
ncbi:MAG: SIR2 family protein [Magnetococcales bacterium]|nr:SIR2 family protein [Magnetococcales bacterium]